VSLGVGFGRAAHADRCPQCCLFFVSVAHAVVLENAGTICFYTKRCLSSRLHSLVLQVARQKLESEAHNMVLAILRTAAVATLIEEDKTGGICR
jgi:hypothetical protein